MKWVHEFWLESICIDVSPLCCLFQLMKKKGVSFDIAFTSVLKRAIKTLYLIQEGTDMHWVPVFRSWRLNERHYGGLQGLNKAETAQKHGEEQVKVNKQSSLVSGSVCIILFCNEWCGVYCLKSWNISPLYFTGQYFSLCQVILNLVLVQGKKQRDVVVFIVIIPEIFYHFIS